MRKNNLTRKTIVVVGGGSAGMLTAMFLSEKYRVYLVEKEKTLGRKFLVAGKGGFNLTNNAQGDALVKQYSPSHLLAPSLKNFTNNDLRKYLSKLGIVTFVGSSNRVFPVKGIKPIEVLDAFKKELERKNITVLLNHKLEQLNDSNVLLFHNKEKKRIDFDYCVLALGGASWSKTGSDGMWLKLFDNEKIKLNSFQSSNCGVNIKWDKAFVENHAGKPLKNIAISVNDYIVKGEALITAYGLEGNAIYPIIKSIRKQEEDKLQLGFKLDFKPKNSIEELDQKIKNSKSKDYSKQLNLATHELALIKQFTTKEEYLSSNQLIQKVKSLEIAVDSLRPVDEAISTVGGVAVNELNTDFSLKNTPTIYTVGEMVDWDAPTGGYLLQGCFSMAYTVAQALNQKVI